MTEIGSDRSRRIRPEMSVLEVVAQDRQTEAVFKKYDALAGVCLCCQALFETLETVAQRYGLDLDQLLADLNEAAQAD